MKLINKSFAIIIAFLFAGSFTYAQNVTDTITVRATVGSGTSSISILSPAVIDFGGQSLAPTAENSRYLSNEVTIDYFAANGPWQIRVYTTNANNVQGLVSTTQGSTSTITFKITPEDRQGEFGEVSNDDHWSGSDEVLRFFTVLDDDTKSESGDPFYAIAASSANENPSKDSDFKVKFGIDVAGAAIGQTHEAIVTFDLAIL